MCIDRPTVAVIVVEMELPHFESATRRTFLRHGPSAAALLASGTILSACGNSDSKTFASPTNRSEAPTVPGVPTVPATIGTSTASPHTGAGGAVAGASIAFTYAASDTSGRVRNPFVAVWVEDSASKMVGLVSVLFSVRDA